MQYCQCWKNNNPFSLRVPETLSSWTVLVFWDLAHNLCDDCLVSCGQTRPTRMSASGRRTSTMFIAISRTLNIGIKRLDQWAALSMESSALFSSCCQVWTNKQQSRGALLYKKDPSSGYLSLRCGERVETSWSTAETSLAECGTEKRWGSALGCLNQS